MGRTDKTLKETVIEQTKVAGVLPCIKLKAKDDFLAYAQAMYDGGAWVIEVTMTTPGALEAIRCGACAVSGARTFMDRDKIAAEGIGWITGQVARYVEIVRKAKENLPELP